MRLTLILKEKIHGNFYTMKLHFSWVHLYEFNNMNKGLVGVRMTKYLNNKDYFTKHFHNECLLSHEHEITLLDSKRSGCIPTYLSDMIGSLCKTEAVFKLFGFGTSLYSKITEDLWELLFWWVISITQQNKSTYTINYQENDAITCHVTSGKLHCTLKRERKWKCK